MSAVQNAKHYHPNHEKESLSMGRPPVILVMCGCSLATTMLAAVKLEKEAKRRRIKVHIERGMVSDMDELIATIRPDLLVATAANRIPANIRVFSGVPLISSIGQHKLYDELFTYIAQQGWG